MKKPKLEKLNVNIIGNILKKTNREGNQIEMMENTFKLKEEQYIKVGSREYVLKKKPTTINYQKSMEEIMKKIRLNNLIKIKLRKKWRNIKMLESDKRLIIKNSSGNCVDIYVYDKKIEFKVRNRDKNLIPNLKLKK
jgi:hypothetical protein